MKRYFIRVYVEDKDKTSEICLESIPLGEGHKAIELADKIQNAINRNKYPDIGFFT